MDNQPGDDSGRLPDLRVGGVDAALDWAWLFAVGQGDFAAARAAAEEALAERRDADTLAARAVVHQLQGELEAALALLEESFAAAPDEGRRVLIAALATLVERKRADALPDGDSVNFTEAIQLWGPSGGDTGWTRRYGAARARIPSPQEPLAAGYVYYVLASVMTWRNVLWSGNESSRAEMLQDFTNQLALWAQQAIAAGDGRLLRALHGLHAEVTAAAGRTDDALRILEAQAQVRREAGDVPGVAWCSLYRGDILATPPSLGRPVLFGYAVREQPTSTSSTVEPQQFDRSGIDLAGARAAYEEARRVYAEAGAQRGVGMATLRLAYLDALDEARGWAQAARAYAEAETIFKRAGDRANVWLARAGQLWARLGAGEAGLAAQARPLAEEMKDAGALAWGLCLGLALARAGREALALRGDVGTAVRAAHAAEVFFEVFDAPLKRSQVCNDRSQAWGSLEATENAVLEGDAALGWLELAAERPLPDPHLAKLLGVQQAYNLVTLYSGLADSDGLERALERARGFARDVPRVSAEEITRLREAALGPPPAAQDSAPADAEADPVASDMARVRELYAKYQPYLIHETIRLIEEQVSVYAPQARGARAMNEADEERAARFFEEALRAADTQVERDYHRAVVFALWRKPDEARAALERYIADGMPDSSAPLGDTQSALAPDLDPALYAERQRMVQVSARQRAASLFAGIGAWAEARRELKEVERIAGGPPSQSAPVPTTDEIGLLAQYAQVAEGLGELEGALEYSSRAVEGLEARRRYLRQENIRRALGGQRFNIGLYAEHARLLAAHGDWAQAFAVAEMTRARVLAESLGGARAATEQLKAGEAYRRYAEQAAAVERLTTQLASARQEEAGDQAHARGLAEQLTAAAAELDAREEALGREAPQWRELTAPRADTLTAAQVAERLPPGTQLIAYLFFYKYLLSWAVTREGLVGHGLVTELDGETFRSGLFAARARAWVRQVSRRADEEAVRVTLSPSFGAALAEALLGRYDEAVARAEHLLIVPFAELNTLPFQALEWRGRPLGLQKPISYLPAASLLQYFRAPETGADGALVVGDPEAMSYADSATGRVETLDPLPAARLEAEVVARLHGARPLVGAEASEENVRAALRRAPRLIHFATHGFLQEGAPLASGVALANGEAITADELMGLDLKADVVVFSACDTGRGRLQGSELVGLARGLLYAGAQAAVVSLWPVDDVATAMLMEFFHEELRGSEPPARALWRAQLRLQQTGAGEALPYFTRAADAYAQAAEALAAAGRAGAAERFRVHLRTVKLRARQARQSPARRPFEAAGHWAAFQVIGDWR
jgi:CHAT domain-containing protein